MIATTLETYRFRVPARITTVSPSLIAAVSLAVIATAIAAHAGAGLRPAGDAALHVDLASRISSQMTLNTGIESHYPPLYHLLGAIGHALFGPAGVQAISFVAFGTASIFTFLFARELARSDAAALAAQGLVTFSPVMLWYSSQALMEPVLVAVVMAALYLALRAVNDPTTRNLLLLVASLTAVALTKQTGLPVVLAALVFLVIRGTGIRRVAMVAVLVAAASAGPYLFIYSQTGALTDPGQIPVSEIERRDGLLTAGLADRVEPWSAALDAEVDGIELYRRGTVQHEARKVYWANIWRWDRFESIHTLYPQSFRGYEQPVINAFHIAISLSIAAGFAVAIIHTRKKPGLILLLLTLGISYAAMSWGTDTRRLFLYVPVAVSLLVVLPYLAAWPHLREWTQRSANRQRNARTAISVIGVAALFLAVLAVAPLLSEQVGEIRKADSTQGGGFISVGGVDSIAETGDWLRARLGEDEAFVAASVYEWEYYSGRENLWDDGLDYRTYFLSAERLDHYLQQAGASYVVVRLNQVVSDEEWNHIELIPASFLETLEENYPVAHTSIYGDIKVFDTSLARVASQSAIAPIRPIEADIDGAIKRNA